MGLSEREIVGRIIHYVDFYRALGGCSGCTLLISGLLVGLLLAVCGVGATSEQLKRIDGDFGSVSLGTGLIGIGACAKTSFDIELSSFPNEFLGHVGILPPGYDIVPFSVFAGFSVTVTVFFGRCKSKGCNFCRLPSLGISIKVTYFGVTANVTDQNNFVYRHNT